MKFNNVITKIKVNHVYFWDVAQSLTTLHNGTKRIKVISIMERKNSTPLATVQSIETKEVFQTDIAHLQLNPALLNIYYWILFLYYKMFNNKLIFECSINRKTYVIIGDQPEVNNLLLLDNKGKIDSFDYCRFKNLQLKRNEDYDRQQYEYMEDFRDDLEMIL
jgi:hypothetical protein